MAFHWYVLHVKPHKERPVYRILEAKHVQVYYPALKVKPVNPRARKERPFFPGYIFVYLDLEETGVNVLQWTEGTHGLVQFGGEPAVVSEYLVFELRSRLDQIQAEGGLKSKSMKQGDRVRITGGMLEGYEAIFDAHLPAKDRVQVLLTYLKHQPKRLQIDSTHVEKLE